MFNVLLPEYITNIILALLVTPTMWRMGVQAARLHRAEAAAKRAAAEALSALSGKAMQVGVGGALRPRTSALPHPTPLPCCCPTLRHRGHFLCPPHLPPGSRPAAG